MPKETVPKEKRIQCKFTIFDHSDNSANIVITKDFSQNEWILLHEKLEEIKNMEKIPPDYKQVAKIYSTLRQVTINSSREVKDFEVKVNG